MSSSFAIHVSFEVKLTTPFLSFLVPLFSFMLDPGHHNVTHGQQKNLSGKCGNHTSPSAVGTGNAMTHVIGLIRFLSFSIGSFPSQPARRPLQPWIRVSFLAQEKSFCRRPDSAPLLPEPGGSLRGREHWPTHRPPAQPCPDDGAELAPKAPFLLSPTSIGNSRPAVYDSSRDAPAIEGTLQARSSFNWELEFHRRPQ